MRRHQVDQSRDDDRACPICGVWWNKHLWDENEEPVCSVHALRMMNAADDNSNWALLGGAADRRRTPGDDWMDLHTSLRELELIHDDEEADS